MNTDFKPLELESDLIKQLREANSPEEKKVITNELVELYVQYGEFFKMSTVSDPKLAKRNLEKALLYQKDHPVANYRLAHLLYREGEFLKALTHFSKSVEGSPMACLNDSQMMLARMFMVNCGILLARESLEEIAELQEDARVTFDKALISQYQHEIYASKVESLDRMLFRKKTSKDNMIISEAIYNKYMDHPPVDTVILSKTDKGIYLKTRNSKPIPLDETAFRVSYTIITSTEFLSNEEIVAKLTSENGDSYVTEENVRQIFSRRLRRFQDFDLIFESSSVMSQQNRKKTTHRLHPKCNYIILCQADTVLPFNQ